MNELISSKNNDTTFEHAGLSECLTYQSPVPVLNVNFNFHLAESSFVPIGHPVRSSTLQH